MVTLFLYSAFPTIHGMESSYFHISNKSEVKWRFEKTGFEEGLSKELGFPGGSVEKNLPASTGDTGLISGLEKSPGAGNGNPLQYSCLGRSHGQRSLAGYSPWGHKESGATEDMNTIDWKSHLIPLRTSERINT